MCMCFVTTKTEPQLFFVLPFGPLIDLCFLVKHVEAHSNRAVIIIAPVLGVAFLAAVCVLLACRKFKKRPG